MEALIILAVAITLGIIVINPKWGSFLIWLILFTYPHSFWFYRQYLPLNIGFDDLFCIILFFAVLVVRNLLGGVPVRFGYAFWVITAFTIVAAVATVSGSRYAEPSLRSGYLKEILKLGVYWCLFYAIIHCIDDERDLKMQFFMFSVAAVAGAGIVILQFFFPYAMIHWTAPAIVAKHGALQYQGRASGSFMNANAAACVLVCSLTLVTTAIRLQKRMISKIIVYMFIFVLLIGILLTQSRAGLMAFGGILVLMAFWGRGKKVAWFIIAAVIIVSVVFAGTREMFAERVKETYDVTTGTWAGNVEARVQLWMDYFRTATPQIYVFGQGALQGVARNGTESHSAYVSLITVYGFGGVAWAIIALIIFFRKTRAVRHVADPLLNTISAGCVWAILAWGIYATSADALSSNYTRYLLFYLVVLVDRVNCFAQQEEMELFYGDEQDYYNEPCYA